MQVSLGKRRLPRSRDQGLLLLLHHPHGLLHAHFLPGSHISATQTWTKRRDRKGHALVRRCSISVPKRSIAPPSLVSQTWSNSGHLCWADVVEIHTRLVRSGQHRPNSVGNQTKSVSFVSFCRFGAQVGRRRSKLPKLYGLAQIWPNSASSGAVSARQAWRKHRPAFQALAWPQFRNARETWQRVDRAVATRRHRVVPKFATHRPERDGGFRHGPLEQGPPQQPRNE